MKITAKRTIRIGDAVHTYEATAEFDQPALFSNLTAEEEAAEERAQITSRTRAIFDSFPAAPKPSGSNRKRNHQRKKAK